MFAPPEWEWAADDGTFGNRFDDPGAFRGIPQEERLRVVYCASQRAGAFGETIARYRKSIKLLAGLKEVEDDEPFDPELEGGVLPKEWRLNRRIGATLLDSSLEFADFSAPETLAVLREEMAPILAEIGAHDFDFSEATSRQRRLTQEVARHIYEATTASGEPRFAGIKYLSRLNLGWELWAVFSDRMVHDPVDPYEDITTDDPDLRSAAALLGITIE